MGERVKVFAGAATASLVVAVAVLVRALVSCRSSSAVRRRLLSAPLTGARHTLVSVAAMAAPEWFVRRVDALDIGVQVDRVWRFWLMGAVLVSAGGPIIGGPMFGAVLLAAWLSAPFGAFALGKGRQARRVDAQLPGALDAIGSGLSAGGSLHQSVLDAAVGAPMPLGRELDPLVRSCRAGEYLGEQLDMWAGRSGSRSVQMVVAAITLGLHDGGPQARVLAGVARSLRDRLAVEGEMRALSSQARASAAVIVVAPVVFTLCSAAVDPSVVDFLTGTPGGLLCIVAGLTLDSVGALWMARIVRGAS